MALTPLQVTNVCDAGLFTWPPSKSGGSPCKYLTREINSKGNYVSLCTKLAPAEYAKIKNGNANANIWGTTARTGDNCNGYLYLKHKKQGYDVP